MSDTRVGKDASMLIATNKLIAIGLAVFASVAGVLTAILAQRSETKSKD